MELHFCLAICPAKTFLGLFESKHDCDKDLAKAGLFVGLQGASEAPSGELPYLACCLSPVLPTGKQFNSWTSAAILQGVKATH